MSESAGGLNVSLILFWVSGDVSSLAGNYYSRRRFGFLLLFMCVRVAIVVVVVTVVPLVRLDFVRVRYVSSRVEHLLCRRRLRAAGASDVLRARQAELDAENSDALHFARAVELSVGADRREVYAMAQGARTRCRGALVQRAATAHAARPAHGLALVAVLHRGALSADTGQPAEGSLCRVAADTAVPRVDRRQRLLRAVHGARATRSESARVDRLVGAHRRARHPHHTAVPLRATRKARRRVVADNGASLDARRVGGIDDRLVRRRIAQRRAKHQERRQRHRQRRRARIA
jgi:hypothetical protein